MARQMTEADWAAVARILHGIHERRSRRAEETPAAQGKAVRGQKTPPTGGGR